MKKKLLVVAGLLIFLSVLFYNVRRHYVVPILMYHHIEAVYDKGRNYTDPQTFAWQMSYIKDKGYRVISLQDMAEAIKQGQTLPMKTVVITFDDGYADNYTVAYSILKKHGFPATIFMPYDHIGKEGYVTAGQIKEMVANNISIGGHGYYEKYLPDEPVESQRFEIFESKKKLEELTGQEVKIFAYHIGGFSDSIKALVKEAGYMAACATNRGTDRWNRDLFELKRVSMSFKDKRADDMWIKLSGYYNSMRKLKNPH